MKSLRERAARALCALAGQPEDTRWQGQPMWRSYLPEVDAMLLAIREPTTNMVVAGDREFRNSIRFDKAALAWHAMIDTAMKEG